MAWLEVHPDCREMLASRGLVKVADFLALQGVICCGHPDRNVARLTLDTPAFLKREHRVRWRDRWANFWAGFSFVSKSRREFAMLRKLETVGIGSPQAIAAGEDDKGRAFLLVRELEGAKDLRFFLEQMRTIPVTDRRDLACELGTVLARIHNAGFEHGDLYSKHVLVRTTPLLEYCFLDWQRAQRRLQVSWAARWRDLAALDATLADELVPPRERLRVLSVYLRSLRGAPTLAFAAMEIRRRSLRLLQRRRIREMRQPPLATGVQNLIWLDGEAVQVTREFREELKGQIPDCLKKVWGAFSVRSLSLPGSRIAHLATRGATQPWRWLWSCLLRKPMVAPEVESMKTHFRLQRYGVVLPRLLAAGQKQNKPWQIQSFLLTESIEGAVPLAQFLTSADRKTKRDVIRQAAIALRQMHQATCYARPSQRIAMGDLLAVTCHNKTVTTVALTTVYGVEKCAYPHPARGQRDLAALANALTATCTRTELLLGLLAYTGQKRLSFALKQFVYRVLRRIPKNSSSRRIAA